MSSIAIATIALLIYWIGTCVSPASGAANDAAELEDREPQETSFNNGQYTPYFGGTEAAVGSSQALVAAPASSAPLVSPAASSVVASSAPAPTPTPSSTPTSTPLTSPSPTPSPASSLPSSAPSPAPSPVSLITYSDPTGLEVITASASLNTLPPLPSNSSPSSTKTSATAVAAGTTSSTPATFKPIYLIPGLLLVGLFISYALGRWLYKRYHAAGTSRSRSVLTARTARTDYEKGGWGGGKRDSAAEELLGGAGGAGRAGGVKGWMEHTLSYDSTDIFGREEPAPAYQPQQQVPYQQQGGYYDYGQQHQTYAPRQPPPTPSKTSRHGSVYSRTAQYFASNSNPASSSSSSGGNAAGPARRPSWFRRVPVPAAPVVPTSVPQQQPMMTTAAVGGQRAGWGKTRGPALRGPRPTPLRTYTLYDMPVPEEEDPFSPPGKAYARQADDEHGDVRHLLLSRQPQQGEEGKTPSSVSESTTAPSPSVYSLASPPPVGVRLGGRGRSRGEGEREGYGGNGLGFRM